MHEKTRCHVLQDDAARAHANGFYHFVIVRCRQDNDVRSQRITFHFAQHRQAILSGHAQIEHKDVWAKLPHRPQRIFPIRGARQDLEVRLQGKNLLEPIEDDGVIVGQYKRDGHLRLPLILVRRARRRLGAALGSGS